MARTRVSRADVAQELFTLFHAVRQVTFDQFREQGISFARAKVLWTLQDSGPLRASVLAARLDCAAATATELVDALTRDDLVARAADPHDRRAVLIDLTPAGRDMAAATQTHKHRVLEAAFEQLDDEQVEQLRVLLDRLVTSPTLQGAQS